jgi:hypothetical protein
MATLPGHPAAGAATSRRRAGRTRSNRAVSVGSGSRPCQCAGACARKFEAGSAFLNDSAARHVSVDLVAAHGHRPRKALTRQPRCVGTQRRHADCPRTDMLWAAVHAEWRRSSGRRRWSPAGTQAGWHQAVVAPGDYGGAKISCPRFSGRWACARVSAPTRVKPAAAPPGWFFGSPLQGSPLASPVSEPR